METKIARGRQTGWGDRTRRVAPPLQFRGATGEMSL
uniref:Uncharacterized protein n=1 Tax=Arundo donax TaxID=35708 RepID=A0A0A9BCV5_ARUDO